MFQKILEPLEIEIIKSVENQSSFKLIISGKRNKKSDLNNIYIKPVMLKEGLMLNFVYRYNTRDITQNYGQDKSWEIIKQNLENDFWQADFYGQHTHILISMKGKGKIKSRPLTDSPITHTLEHNHQKKRYIETQGNVYLRELNVTTAEGDIKKDRNHKFVQIHRYIEILSPELEGLNTRISVSDMGSGKGYLSFALYDYLQNTLKISTQMRGIEYRRDLVDACNRIAQNCEFEGLQFLQGTIEDAAIEEEGILIALHACNTATDDAIFKGIQAQSQLIVCAPCCHKQVRKDMNPPAGLSVMLKHGILLERQAELLTDSLRALYLEAHGYKTRVIEFVSGEHTPKNIMIIARKTHKTHPRQAEILQTISELKQQFGIREHYLGTLLGC